MTPAWRALAAAALVVAFGDACQILGCEPRRCAPGDPVGACPDTQFCAADGFCRDRPVVDACALAERPADEGKLRLDTEQGGVDAIGEALAGQAPALVADARDCHDQGGDCDLAGAGENPRAVQPLGGALREAPSLFATELAVAPLVLAHGGVDLSEGFAVEAIVRATDAPDAVIASMGAEDDDGDGVYEGGWAIETDANGLLLFRAGNAAVLLDLPLRDVWVHVLCTVDVEGLGVLDDDDVVCAIDGRPAYMPALEFNASPDVGDGAAPLVLGAYAPGEAPVGSPAVAVVRLWTLSLLGAPADGPAIGSIDAVVDEERRRLLRYVGLDLALPAGARILATNFGFFPRAQPVRFSGFHRHELVGAGWPRVAHDERGTVGLLLEPQREDLALGALAACAAPARTTLVGRDDACVVSGARSATVQPRVRDPETNQLGAPRFDAGDVLVLSVFADAPAVVRVDGEVVCGEGVGEEPVCVSLEAEGAATRQLARFAAPPASGGCTPTRDTVCPARAFTVEVEVDGVVWSPQLERGFDPSAPFNFLVTDPQTLEPLAGAVNFGDAVAVTGLNLPEGEDAALRATVTTDGVALSMAPVAISDDANGSGNTATLFVGSNAEGQGVPVAVVGDAGGAEFLAGDDTFDFESGQPARVGVDLGAPDDGCSGCAADAVRFPLAGPVQWDVVSFAGGFEPGLLVDADVVANGIAALPLALDIQVGRPAGGCLRGARAPVSLVVCDGRACSENDDQIWSGETSTAAAPGVDEQAIAGAVTTDVELAFDELYFEVRAAAGEDGRVVALLDDDGAPLLEVRAEGGDAVVAHPGGAFVAAPGVWAAEGEWNQLACWLGAHTRCIVNAGAPVVVADTDVDLAGAVARSVDVGGGPAAVAFARVWPQPAGVAAGEIARVVDARVAATFGFVAPERRGAFATVELRDAPATIARQGGDVVVGRRWPRVEEDEDGAAVYRAQGDEGLEIATSDIASFAGTTLEMQFTELGDGRFLGLFAAPQADAGEGDEVLALVREGGTIVVEGDSIVRILNADERLTVDGFDGARLGLALRLGVVVLESGAEPSVNALVPFGIDGGERVVVAGPQGSGAPLGLRAMRIVAP